MSRKQYLCISFATSFTQHHLRAQKRLRNGALLWIAINCAVCAYHVEAADDKESMLPGISEACSVRTELTKEKSSEEMCDDKYVALCCTTRMSISVNHFQSVYANNGKDKALIPFILFSIARRGLSACLLCSHSDVASWSHLHAGAILTSSLIFVFRQ